MWLLLGGDPADCQAKGSNQPYSQRKPKCSSSSAFSRGLLR